MEMQVQIQWRCKMKCNYKRPKLTKEERQETASMRSTLPYIDRLQIEQRIPKESRKENEQ